MVHSGATRNSSTHFGDMQEGYIYPNSHFVKNSLLIKFAIRPTQMFQPDKHDKEHFDPFRLYTYRSSRRILGNLFTGRIAESCAFIPFY